MCEEMQAREGVKSALDSWDVSLERFRFPPQVSGRNPGTPYLILGGRRKLGMVSPDLGIHGICGIKSGSVPGSSLIKLASCLARTASLRLLTNKEYR